MSPARRLQAHALAAVLASVPRVARRLPALALARVPRVTRRLPVLAVAAALASAPRVASACAACGAGDPTLSALGTEAPYENRLRLALAVTHRTDEVGNPRRNLFVLDEHRFDTSFAWAPSRRLFLSAMVPTLHRRLEASRQDPRSTWGVGDAELRAKAFLYRDREYGARHLFAVTGGVKAPTAPRQKGDDGQPLPAELQPGTGSWDGLVGASHALSMFPWAGFVSANLLLPGKGAHDSRASRSLRLTTAAQRHLGDKVALRFGLDGRFDGRATSYGMREHDSGGFIGFVSGELLVSPKTDLTFFSSLKWPVYQALWGEHREGPYLSTGVAIDF